jgi:hypothetical protein
MIIQEQNIIITIYRELEKSYLNLSVQGEGWGKQYGILEPFMPN